MGHEMHSSYILLVRAGCVARAFWQCGTQLLGEKEPSHVLALAVALVVQKFPLSNVSVSVSV